jgi:hypothetical protein
MDFYIFQNTGEYIGMRGSMPNEIDLIGLESTTENIEKMSNYIKPFLLDGVITESATQQEIEDFRKSQVPQTSSKMRFFLALYNIGITRNMVYEVINQITDENLKEIILIKFDLSQEFDRNDEHLILLANQFNILDIELDNLFIQANE